MDHAALPSASKLSLLSSELQLSCDLRAQVFQESADPIIIEDLQGRILDMNPEAELAYGWSRQELLGQPVTVLIPPERHAHAHLIRQHCRAGKQVRNIEGLRMTRDKRLHRVLLTLALLHDQTGAPVALVSLSKDMTRGEQVWRAEQGHTARESVESIRPYDDLSTYQEALRESEERFRTLADNMAQLAWMADKTGWIFWYNKRWFDYTGTVLEEMAGWGWQKVHHPDHLDRVVASIQHSWETGEPWEDVFPLRGRDGTYRWFLSRALPIRDAQGAVVRWFGTNTDVTEQRQAREALQQAYANLEQRVAERTAELSKVHDDLRHEMAERQRMQEALFQQEKLAALGTLLANVAHELNNPLAIATMQLDNLEETWGTGTWSEDFSTLRQAITRCGSIVQSFLGLARQQPPSRSIVALHDIIREALSLQEHSLTVDNITVHLELAEDLPKLWADPHQLYHVVTNLITNAHHALRHTANPRQLYLATATNAERTWITMQVTDSGSGIPEDMQRRIFEPFFTTKGHANGSGLGLALCRNIVEGHGGSITVSSQPGQGTIFSITLPVDIPVAACPPPLPVSIEAVQTQRAAILLIDDEVGLALALQHLLRRSGHTITTATNGREGLTALAERFYEVILCDMRMPDLDGPGFYRALEQSYPHLLSRIIFLTGDVLSGEAREFFARIQCPRLIKPFKAREVRQAIQQILEAHP